MSNVKSHCLTNILTNKNHQSSNFIPHYFIAKTAFFQTKILQFGPLKTVDMHYLPNMRLIACKTIAWKRAFVWLVSGPRTFRININTTEFWLNLLLAPPSVLPHPTLDQILHPDRGHSGPKWGVKQPFSKNHDFINCLTFVIYESHHSANLGFFYGLFLSYFSPEIFVFENAHSWLFLCLYTRLNSLNIAQNEKSTEKHHIIT